MFRITNRNENIAIIHRISDLDDCGFFAFDGLVWYFDNFNILGKFVWARVITTYDRLSSLYLISRYSRHG